MEDVTTVLLEICVQLGRETRNHKCTSAIKEEVLQKQTEEKFVMIQDSGVHGESKAKDVQDHLWG